MKKFKSEYILDSARCEILLIVLSNKDSLLWPIVSIVILAGIYISMFETIMRNKSTRKIFIKCMREGNIALEYLKITIKRRISNYKGIADFKKTKD